MVAALVAGGGIGGAVVFEGGASFGIGGAEDIFDTGGG